MVPGLPPIAIVTKPVRPRRKLSAKVLDLSTKAIVEPYDIERSLFRMPPLKLPEMMSLNDVARMIRRTPHDYCCPDGHHLAGDATSDCPLR